MPSSCHIPCAVKFDRNSARQAKDDHARVRCRAFQATVCIVQLFFPRTMGTPAEAAVRGSDASQSCGSAEDELDALLSAVVLPQPRPRCARTSNVALPPTGNEPGTTAVNDSFPSQPSGSAEEELDALLSAVELPTAKKNWRGPWLACPAV